MTVDPVVRDRERRFGGVARLYGGHALETLAAAHATIVGVGGVGSWTAEALARSGVGRLTLVDMDHVAESNINRQVHALEPTLGQSKIVAMAERIAAIAPDCRVDCVDDFIDPDNASSRVPESAGVVVDAIDAPRAKAALIACCVRRAQTVLVCGGAGGRTDPLLLRRADLADVRHDRLLASVRSRLRREHGFTRTAGARLGVTALWFDAAAAPPMRGDVAAGAPLACAGYGSIVTVTAPMGFTIAAMAIEHLLSAGSGR